MDNKVTVMQKLTKAEEEIMQIIWEISPCTVHDILNYMESELQMDRPPHSTISSIVRIIEKKGFLDHKAYGRTYEYFTIVTKEDYGKKSLQKVVREYFNGSISSLVSFLISEEKLSLEELKELTDELNQD